MSVELFRTVIDSLPQGIVICDPLGRTIFTNARCDDVLGARAQSLGSYPLHQLFVAVGEDGALPELHFGEIWDADLDLEVPGFDPLPLRVCATPLHDENDKFVAQLFVLTPRSHDADASHHTSKLELLGRLAGGIAHDLNNTLTGVLGHISFLRLSLPEGFHSESLLAAEDGARRACSTAQQILDFARGEEAKLRSVNLSLVIAAGANLLRAALPKDIVLRVAEDEEDILVFGEENQLSHMFMNLAVNARDALPHGGQINVELSKVRTRDGDMARLAIRDNGVGIPEHLQDQIFQPFFTTKDAGRGTGLGLANVAETVRAHGGTISVQSAENCGALFEVLLPLYRPIEINRTREEAQFLPTGHERILVVEDEEMVRTVIQKSLEHLGYRVDVAENGEVALERFIQNGGQYHLIVLDVMMPLMAGDELFFRLQEIQSTVPVLIASGYAPDSRTRALLDAGGRGFIQKPFGIEDLAREVRRCIDEGPVPLPQTVE